MSRDGSSSDTAPDVSDLLDSWLLALAAERKSPGTLKAYGASARTYIGWCQELDEAPTLRRSQIQRFLIDAMERGREDTTVALYVTSLRSFSKWCAIEGEIDVDEAKLVAYPKRDEKHRPILPEADFVKIIATCDRTTFLGKRDEAILRLMLDAGMRSSELLGLTLADVSIPGGTALVHGKGGKDRIVAFSGVTGTALDRYLRARRRLKGAAEQEKFWLGERGRGFAYGALWQMVNRRGEQAGVKVHPHMTRRTWADTWLSNGGSSDGLMALAGWTSMAMVKHYTGARANARAIEEHKRLFGK